MYIDAPRLRAVVHVEAEVVARAVHHVAAVELVLGLERLLGRHRQEAPLGRLARDDLHRGGVHLAEDRAGPHDGERGVRGLEHGLVDLALHGGERAVHRERARDVGRVVAVELDAGVEQHQVAGHHGAVVAGPVQDRRVRAGCGDRAVADVVAVEPGAGREDALDDALAAHLGGDARQLADDLGEAALRRVDRGAHLGELELVLHEAELGEHAGELGVGLVLGADLDRERGVRRVRRERLLGGEADAGVVDALGDGCVGLAQHERRGVDRVDDVVEVVEAARRDVEVGGDVRERRARADPELADRGVGVELLGVAAGALAEVDGRRRGRRRSGSKTSTAPGSESEPQPVRCANAECARNG